MLRLDGQRLFFILFLIMSGLHELSAASLKPMKFAELEGWSSDDHQEALAAFQRSCREIIAEGKAFGRPIVWGGTREDWLPVCRKALEAADARLFFEQEFEALAVADTARPEGLFTGYYEPEAEASLTRSKDYGVPIYGKPSDLVAFDAAASSHTGLRYGRLIDGKPHPYFTRQEIEEGALEGKGLELVWLKDWVDAFFIHIQGSGLARLEDGSAVRLAYAAKSGQPYTGIGRLLVDRGILTEDRMSMQNLRGWMAKNPQAARLLMWENRSFIFFRKVTGLDQRLGAPGAQQVQLTPLRSLAVDRGIWAFGTPVWLDANVPEGPEGSLVPFRHLLIAQDTGTAIKGAARGDVYWGWGENAALTAGAMKSPGRMVVLLPRPLAQRLSGRH